MRSLKLSVLSLGLVAGVSSTAAAQQVNFDDLTGFLTTIESPYAGFNWSNAFTMNVPVVYGAGVAAGGFGTALSSGNHVVLNGGGNALGLSGSTFNLLSGTFAAAWTNGLNLNVKGFSGGIQLYNRNYTLDWFTSSNLQLGLFGVDNVIFSSSGGSVGEGFVWDSNQSFAADNLEFGARFVSKRFVFEDGDIGSLAVVPEPLTVSLMAAGLLVLGGVQTRRRRAAATR